MTDARDELNRMADFMTRWLFARGRPWRVEIKVGPLTYAWLVATYAWFAAKIKMRNRPRRLELTLASSAPEDNGEGACRSLLEKCGHTLRARSAEELELRWAALGDETVLAFFDRLDGDLPNGKTL